MEESSLDGKPCVPSKLRNTAEESSCNGKTMASSTRSRSGTMFEPSTASRGVAWWISSLADSRAKTSPLVARETDSTGREVDCGERCEGSFLRWDRDSYSWKTHQCSLFGGWETFSETWPRWGMMRNGECWALTTPDTITAVTASGLLPTCLATDHKGGAVAPRPDNGKLRTDQWRDFVKMKYGLTYPHPTHSEIRSGWPEGWSDSKPLGMDRFREWLRLHGRF